MRLATIWDGRTSVAVVLRDGRPVAIQRPDGTPYADLRAVLEDGEEGRSRSDVALRQAPDVAGEWHFRRPVCEPCATWCVGRNFRAHILETGDRLPSAPVWFGKFAAALTDPDADVPIPIVDDAIDYEGELAVVIGRPTRAIAVEDAWSAVAGVTLFNDVSARTLGRERQNVFYGKNLERSSALGPVLVTPDEFDDVADLRFTVQVNAESRQEGVLSDLLFDIPTLIADLASITTLQPGDVIATGTPGGVGMGFDPPRWLVAGDVVEISCPPIGILRTRFV